MKAFESNDPASGRHIWAMGVSATEDANERCLREVRRTGIAQVELRLPIEMLGTDAGADVTPLIVRCRSEGLAPIGLMIEWPVCANEPDLGMDTMPSFGNVMIRLLDFATDNGVRDIAVRHRGQRAGAGQRPVRYENVLADRLEWLAAYRFEAERLGVRVAIEVGMSDFLATPSEARDFIDQCNSPWIGARLRPNDESAFGHLTDWALSLGRRVYSVEVGMAVVSKQSAGRQHVLQMLRKMNQSCLVVVPAASLDSEPLESVAELRDAVES